MTAPKPSAIEDRRQITLARVAGEGEPLAEQVVGEGHPTADLRIALVQAATIWRDAAANRTLYGDLVLNLKGAADVIVLPETFTSGFGQEAIVAAEGMDGPSVAWLRELAAQADAVITGSMLIADNGIVFNRLLWAQPDGGLHWYDKRHLFRMANEHLRYGEGHERRIFEVRGWRVLPQICYDLRFPVFSRNRWHGEPPRADYDLALYPANWPTPRRHAWRTLLRARAMENLAYVVGVNRVGVDGNDLHYSGDSAVIDPAGNPMIELGAQAQTAVVTLSAQALASHRERFPAWMDADDFSLSMD